MFPGKACLGRPQKQAKTTGQSLCAKLDNWHAFRELFESGHNGRGNPSAGLFLPLILEEQLICLEMKP